MATINGVDDSLASLGPDQVLDMFDKAEQPNERQSQAQLLIELAKDLELFHTADSEAFARFPANDHIETWPVKSRTCRNWLVHQFFKKYRKSVRSQAVIDAVGFLEAKAQFESPEVKVFLRVASLEGRIYIDLCNTEWMAIEITPRGWCVVTEPPVRFRRSKGMLALPTPIPGGNVSRLRAFLNIGKVNDRNWVLFLVWLAAALSPSGPYPILIIEGGQGAAKSTMMRLARKLIDPSAVPMRTLPREERDLMIAATNSWVLAFDNVSSLPQWLSDALCRLATGGGFGTRELYRDNDEVLFDAMRPVMLNGIDHIADRPDLADRAMILQLPEIVDTDRVDEKTLYADFEEHLPFILGAVMDAMVEGLRRLPQTVLDRKPRMADFALWALATESGLGLKPGAFMQAYTENRSEAVATTLEEDLVGSAIRLAMEARLRNGESPEWLGTAGELLTYLGSFTDETSKRSRAWPNNARAMSSRLRRLKSFLKESGIDVVFLGKGTGGRREISIGMVYATATTATTASSDSHAEEPQEHNSSEPSGGTDGGVTQTNVSDGGPPPSNDDPNPCDTIREDRTDDGSGDSGDVPPDFSTPSTTEEGWI